MWVAAFRTGPFPASQPPPPRYHPPPAHLKPHLSVRLTPTVPVVLVVAPTSVFEVPLFRALSQIPSPFPAVDPLPLLIDLLRPCLKILVILKVPLAAPAEIIAPATPVRRATLSPSPDLSAGIKARSSQSDRKLESSQPLSSSDMTPPPSTQIPGAPLRRSHSRSISPSLVTPANLDKSLYDAYGASDNLPSIEDINNANETQLRSIAKDLLAAAQEARMSALHFKLQNSLVSFASNEAVKRAEVEHHLAKREVEILQSAEYRRSRPVEPLTPRQSQSVSSEDYFNAVQRAKELENMNAVLDRRLRRAKRAIDDETARSSELKEKNLMLRKRIEDNRSHFSQLYNFGCLSPGMQNELHNICRGEPTDGLATLLFAGEFTNRIQEPTYRAPTLPMTPNRSSQREEYSTPHQGSQDHRYDSDSTVSLSAQESEEETLHPQHPEARYTAPKTSTLLQTKLFGQVKKPGVDRSSSNKRKAGSNETSSTPKRARNSGGVGLGIET
ncbi:hypothetical protein N7468_006406 [Penicillium chermesinum]|uniref:Uncharacterized protein n=1 Tax=Penicillium chermesinum TaxID=63820 RepID=A0A9W9NS60_9EURO|nr:uncharacterized protein N7468_006406 [Penicillium chermesinum]KAJ5225181.1 hypothetical protein N7468_006406 [Penicillium chermesinum]